MKSIVALANKTGTWVYQSDLSGAVNAITDVYVRQVLLARDHDTPADVLSIAIGPREKARFLATHHRGGD